VEGEGVNEGGEDLTGDQPETDGEHEGEERASRSDRYPKKGKRGKRRSTEVAKRMAW
jgi:hypothetical protein